MNCEFPVPVPIPDETQGECSVSVLKGPQLPKFELGRKEKGKLSVMTALELPPIKVPEEKEMVGEALELQRGLLMSPEKAERKRGKFVRCVMPASIFIPAYFYQEWVGRTCSDDYGSDFNRSQFVEEGNGVIGLLPKPIESRPAVACYRYHPHFAECQCSLSLC